MGLSYIDYFVIVFYLFGVALAGIYSAGRQRSTADYFLGGRSLPWWAVLLSVVATETSTLTFISIPAVAYTGNITFLQIALGYIAGRVGVSLLFMPAYYEGRLATAYQFLGQRFGASMRNITSSTFMVTRLLADGVRLFATAIPLAIILRMGGALEGISDLYIYMMAIGTIALITVIYTLIGGIKAVVWMDVIQMSVYVGGAFIAIYLMLTGLSNGTGAFWDTLRDAGKLEFIRLGFDMNFTEFIREPYTLITAVIGGGVFSVASHGTDQLIVQRLLTTRDLKSSQKALIGSGIVIFLQFALFLGIGLLLYGFYEAKTPAEMGLATADEVFAKFIIEQMPIGLAGLIVASLFAAAMSSLSSSLNSLASSATFDLYKPYWGKDNTAEEDLRISRSMTVGWGIILTGAAFVFAVLQLQSGGERPAVVELGLGIASYTYGGLLGAFVLGMLTEKISRTDAVVGFFSGLTALLFMVKGPIQTILPGEGIAIAWPLYTVVGAAIVVLVAAVSYWIRGKAMKVKR